jgi:hypothetical protein
MYDTIGTIQKAICRTLESPIWILVSVIPCPPKGGKNIDEAWHAAIGTVLSQFGHLDITGPDLKSDCADGLK